MKKIIFTVVALLVFGVAGYAPEAMAVTDITSCPFTITSSGPYELGNDVTATGDCVTVIVSNVVIDLNGHTVTGDGTGSGIRTTGSPVNVIVRNGKIRNFSVGIDFRASTNDVVEKIEVSGCSGTGIFLGDFSTAVKSTSGNNFLGISTGDNCRVIGSTANGNNDKGIFTGDFSTIAYGTTIGNGATGLTIGDNGGVFDSTAEHNSQDGIVTGDFASITDSTAKNNNNDGIRIGDNSSIASSSVIGNRNLGILSGDFSTIIGNKVEHNGSVGIVSLDHSSVIGNKTKRNDGDGIQAGAFGKFIDNESQGNTGRGLAVDCSTTGFVAGNKATGNGGGNLVEFGSQCINLNNNAP